MSTFLHYVHCKDALLDCSTPGGERCESLTWVDEIKDKPLQWRHNEHDGIWNHQRLDSLLNHLCRCRSKKTSKFRITGLCEGNPPVWGNAPVTGGFPSQRASNTEIFPFDDVIMFQIMHHENWKDRDIQNHVHTHLFWQFCEMYFKLVITSVFGISSLALMYWR